MKSILEMLAGGDFVSGEKISRELGVSRVAVWKRIGALKEQGWQIEAGGKRGYRLTAGDSLDPALWTDSLATLRLGRGENRYEKEVTSTNNVIKEMALSGAPDGSLCIAESQSAGKGRLGRAWNAPAGKGLWVSVLLRPRLKPAHAPFITLCAAMAMARAVRETAGLDVRIKWPNDLVADGRKICGILLELSADPDSIEYVVVGTGLNVHPGAYPPELQDRAASVGELAAQTPLRREVLVRYLASLEELIGRLEQEDFGNLAAEYWEQSCTLGREVQVSGAVELTGIADAIDATGALIVRTADGERHRLLSGDVSVRGVMGYV